MGNIMHNGVSYSGASNSVCLTRAQYDALVQAGTVNPNILYAITDDQGEGGVPYTSEQTDTLLAHKTNLTTIAPEETGTTAARAYQAGEYFYLNGYLCYTTVPIAAGDTFDATNRVQIAASAKFQHPFSLTSGQTLTITTPHGGVYAILVATASGASTLNSLTFLSGYNDSAASLKEITSLKTGSDIAVAKTASTFTFTNNHGTYGVQGSIFILVDHVNGLSWSIS